MVLPLELAAGNMLDVLRRIVQEVNAARGLDQALDIIVKRVKQAMAVDACSIYLCDYEQRQHVLMATDGLFAEAVGTVRLEFGKGLIGFIADRAEPLNLDNAPDHPAYLYFPETGEERFHNIVGVPIIHHRKVLGVLLVQCVAQQRTDDDNVSFLVTIAAQLAGAIAHAEASGGINGLSGRSERDAIFIEGVPGAPGVVIATATVIYPKADLHAVPDRSATDVATEEEAFLAAVQAVRQDIEQLIRRLEAQGMPAEDRALFEAYLLMLDRTSGMVDHVLERIRAGNWAPGALREVVLEHVRIFEEMDDQYLSERASDVRDLGVRVLSYLQSNESAQAELPDNVILVGEEISATQLAELPTEKIAGVVSVRGSSNSHVAILARVMGIPAVLGATDFPVSRVDGKTLVVDGYLGRVYVNPSAQICGEYGRLADADHALTAELSELRDLPAETTDGELIPLYANTGLLSDLKPARNSGAQGIGLYRTEFPFMIRDRFPGEEEQCRIYRQVLESFKPWPVVARTLDIGGDKALHYFPIQEDNPFLGWRGIRITLDHPEIFLAQLRAMLRASEGNDNLHILLPMVSNVSEVDEAKVLIQRAYTELVADGLSLTQPRVGVMVEVPSVVYQADALAQRVDFMSIGTNDLTQYLLAVDRNNARVAHLYDSLHPAVLHAIHHVVTAAGRHGKQVSVCGEMAGDPASAIVLLGMGIDSLSMNASSLPRIKWVVRSFTRAKARVLLDEVMVMEQGTQIRARLNEALVDAGLRSLLRPGK